MVAKGEFWLQATIEIGRKVSLLPKSLNATVGFLNDYEFSFAKIFKNLT